MRITCVLQCSHRCENIAKPNNLFSVYSMRFKPFRQLSLVSLVKQRFRQLLCGGPNSNHKICFLLFSFIEFAFSFAYYVAKVDLVQLLKRLFLYLYSLVSIFYITVQVFCTFRPLQGGGEKPLSLIGLPLFVYFVWCLGVQN